MGIGKRQFQIFGNGLFAQMHRNFPEPVYGFFDRTGRFLEAGNFGGFFDGGGDFIEQIHEHRPFVHAQLAAQQIHGLNAVCAFIDAGDFAIAVELFHRIFFGVAVAAENLNGLFADKLTAFTAVSFDNRGQQLDQAAVALLFCGGFGRGLTVKTIGHVVNKAAHPFHVCFHLQQHPPDIRVTDNGHLGGFRVLALFDVSSLQSLAGIIERMQKSHRTVQKTLGADIQAGLVHHVEHDHQAFVFFPEQKAPAIASGTQAHAAGGTAVDAHFILHAAAYDIVGLSQAAVVIDPNFGHDKQRDASGSRWSPFNAGQYRVDDVFRQVVLAAGNKDFVSRNGIRSVRIFNRRGGQRAHIGAGAGFGEQHGAAPLAGINLF